MKDISFYFEPISEELKLSELNLSSVLQVHDNHGFPLINDKGVAIIYVPEYRNSSKQHSGLNEKFIQEFGELFKGDNWEFSIYYLGTIKPGNKIEDTYFAVGQVVAELVKKEIIPVVIGGSQDLTMACYKAFEILERTINICAIDNRLDVGSPEEPINSLGYVSHLLLQRPCYLFNFANVGMQRTLVPKREIQLFEKLYFDICRLGAYNDDFRKAEPHLRNSDLITIDVNAIKSNDFDSKSYDEVNGFRSDQICQIAKYAGMSDKLSCLGLFELAPNQSSQASKLIAQIIWYFIDGIASRVGDFPIGSKKSYTKFNVHLDDFTDDLVFYKSDKSGRWWLEVKYPAGEDGKYERHHLVPCDKDDYTNALDNAIPDLWWKTLQKLI